MKLWIPPRSMLSSTDPNRPVSSYTLHIRHNHSLFINHPYLPRRSLRLSYPIHTCKRSLHILYLPIHARRTGPILWLIPILKNMKHWHYSPTYSHSHRIHRICPTLRPNVLLRSNCHYQSTIGHPLHRNGPSRVNLRRLFRRQGNSNTILCLPLYPPVHHLSTSSSPSIVSTRNRIQQSLWNPI